MNKIVINPVYQELSDFINNIPENFKKEGEVVYKERNEIKLFKIKNKEFAVKSFKIPHLINKIVYAHFRSSKAERSFFNGMKLYENNIGTPAPVAYLEFKKNGLFNQSFYVCEKSRFSREFREICHHPEMAEVYDILTGFALFTADLHNKNIFHKDYTPGNILFGKIEDNYQFELVDINRMAFHSVDIKMGCKNFDKLCIPDDLYLFIAGIYAEARGFDVSECERLIIKYRDPDA